MPFFGFNISYKENAMRYLTLIFTCITVTLLASACNTMEGLGKDIKKGGENLENSADKHK